jgi:predicted ATP-binding protein involved in virulence
MHIIANVVGYSLPRSLLLIDEPETHLHPPLLATLMHAIRFILDEIQAFAIVATHSPVVVQETLSKHVQVVDRVGSTTDVKSTTIETFGENIGAITDEVFRLNSEVTDYHKILQTMVKRCKTLENIENLIGEHGLSMQARAYVMSLLASKKVEA